MQHEYSQMEELFLRRNFLSFLFSKFHQIKEHSAAWVASQLAWQLHSQEDTSKKTK